MEVARPDEFQWWQATVLGRTAWSGSDPPGATQDVGDCGDDTSREGIDEVPVAAALAPDAWLREVFDSWGPLSGQELADATLIDRDRLAPVVLDRVSALVRPVLDDAEFCGVYTDVAVRVTDELAIELAVSWRPERPCGPGGAQLRHGTEVEVLAWLTDSVQEVTMERDQRHCRVWPLCPDHGCGAHVLIREAAVVWWCRAEGGHPIARIGELGGGRRSRRDRRGR